LKRHRRLRGSRVPQQNLSYHSSGNFDDGEVCPHFFSLDLCLHSPRRSKAAQHRRRHASPQTCRIRRLPCRPPRVPVSARSHPTSAEIHPAPGCGSNEPRCLRCQLRFTHVMSCSAKGMIDITDAAPLISCFTRRRAKFHTHTAPSASLRRDSHSFFSAQKQTARADPEYSAQSLNECGAAAVEPRSRRTIATQFTAD
jgi:hypothetical protein